MPTKRYLTFPANRAALRQALERAGQSLSHFDLVLYHYAREDHPLRKTSGDLLRQFKALEKQITARLKTGERDL